MKSLSLTVGFGLIKDALRSPVNTMLQKSYFAGQRKRIPFNTTGDCLIEVTTWTGLT
jgi:hypothetical protein